MQFKSGVNPRYLSAPAWFGAWQAARLHLEDTGGLEAVITSTGEARHSAERSAHYAGEYGFGFSRGFDLRIWHLDNPADFRSRLKKRLGKDYVVVLESDHIHVHWSPTFTPAT